MKKIFFIFFCFCVPAIFAYAQQKFPVTKTDEEWQKTLTPGQYAVTRQSATEIPYKNGYWDNHETGTYYCICCGQPLFSSAAKFDSHTGWPSFYQSLSKNKVGERTDSGYNMGRTEEYCTRCGAHLGHVFDDGPKPTGLRYCMNSLAMKFVKE